MKKRKEIRFIKKEKQDGSWKLEILEMKLAATMYEEINPNNQPNGIYNLNRWIDQGRFQIKVGVQEVIIFRIFKDGLRWLRLEQRT